MILVLDTSGLKTYIGLWGDGWIAKEEWDAGHSLSSEIIEKMDSLYQKAGITLADTKKIVVNTGPGSFTGLRIGLSIANALAYALNIPIAGIVCPKNYEDLMEKGIKSLEGRNKFGGAVLPEYGSEPNITKPKKSF